MCSHVFWAAYSVPVPSSDSSFFKDLRTPQGLESAVKKVLSSSARVRSAQTGMFCCKQIVDHKAYLQSCHDIFASFLGHLLSTMKRVECSSKSGDEKRLEKGYHEYANASGRTKLHKVGSFFVCFQCNVFPSVPFVFIIRFFFAEAFRKSRDAQRLLHVELQLVV
jgi:hypothetical protein